MLVSNPVLEVGYMNLLNHKRESSQALYGLFEAFLMITNVYSTSKADFGPRMPPIQKCFPRMKVLKINDQENRFLEFKHIYQPIRSGPKSLLGHRNKLFFHDFHVFYGFISSVAAFISS